MKTTLTIQNLKCGGCSNTIVTKLTTLQNVENVTVAIDTATVSFNAHTKQAALHAQETLTALGYPPITQANGLRAKAKSFISCATGKIK